MKLSSFFLIVLVAIGSSSGESLSQSNQNENCGWSHGCTMTGGSTILNRESWAISRLIHRPHYFSLVKLSYYAHDPKDVNSVEGLIANNRNIMEHTLGNSVVQFVTDAKTGYGEADVRFSSFATPLNVEVLFRLKSGVGPMQISNWTIVYEPANPSGGKTFGILLALVILALLPVALTIVTFYLDEKNGISHETVGPYRYPLIPPKPIPQLEGKTEFFRELWTQPIHGFRIFNLNHHDIAWIWFPADEEKLTKNRRIATTFFVLWFMFLFQFYWNDFATLWADGISNERTILHDTNQSFFGHFLLAFIIRFLISDMIAYVFRILGKKLFGFFEVMPNKVLWNDDSNANKRYFGMALNYGGLFVVAFVFVFLFARLFVDEAQETFGYVLVWSVGPFIAATAWRAIGFSLALSYLLYRLKSTWGEAWTPSQDDDSISLVREQNRDAARDEDSPLFGAKRYGTEESLGTELL